MSEPRKRLQGAGGDSKAGGSSSSQQVAAADVKSTMSSESYALVVEALAEGPIVGLVNGAKSIFFDDTPLQNDDDTFNFENVKWAMVNGDPDQDWLPGFSNVSSEISVGTQVFHDIGAVVRTTTNQNLDTIIVRIRIPKLIKIDNKGNPKNNNVAFTIGYKKIADPSFTTFSYNIGGISTTEFEKQYSFNVRPPGDLYTGGWNIMVQRDTNDHDSDTTKADQLFWQSYTEVEEVKMIYPDTAMIGFNLPGKTFNGGVPVRSYDLKGRIVRIPSNYNPTTRAYTGLWDGTYTTAWTDNPAWCLFDLLTTNRYGLGLPDSRVDTAALYTIGQYCDQMINDGSGGLQPRYTLNVCINDQAEAYDLINKLCATFVTMAYYSSGAVTFSQDSPRNADMLVTRSNAIEGRFQYQEQSWREQPNTVMVTWSNPELGGKGDVEAVEDQVEIRKRGRVVTRSIDLAGITDRNRAQRLARWQLYSSIFDGQVVTYRAGLDHADCLPGWIVSIRDPLQDGAQYGGRIIDWDTNTVTLDRPITATATSLLMVLRPDKTIGEFTILSPLGTPATVFTINTQPATERPDLAAVGAHALGVGALGRWDAEEGTIGSVWGLLDTANLPEKLWRVISKSPVDNNMFEIVAVRHYPAKYDLIESGKEIDADQFSSTLTGPIDLPSSISAVEYLQQTPAGTTQSNLMVGWKGSSDARVTQYRVQYKSNTDGVWVLAGITDSLSQAIIDLPLDTYDIRVRAESPLGRYSNWATQTGVVIDGVADAPANITNLTLSVQGATGILAWDAITQFQLSHYEVRFTSDTSTPSWETAAILFDDLVSATVQVSVQGGTYLVKAVSYGGTYSATAAQVVCLIPVLSPPNVLVDVGEETAWAGYQFQTTVVANQLKLAHDPNLSLSSALGAQPLGKGAVGRQEVGDFGYKATGYYVSFGALAIDLGQKSVCRVTPKLTYFGDNQADTLDTWTSLSTVETLGGIVPGDFQVYIEFRFTDQNPLGISASVAGVNYGDMTGGGGINAAFDTTTSQAIAASASKAAATSAYLGRDLTTPTKIHRVRVYSTSDQGFVSGSNPTLTWELWGKVGVTAPSSDVDGVKLGQTTYTDTATTGFIDIFSYDDVTVWDNFHVRVTGLGGVTVAIAEVQLFSPPTDWSAWSLGVVGDYAFRGMQTRTQLVSNNQDVTPVIVSQHLEIDMPDRTVGDNNVSVSASGVGLDVTFSPSFIFLKGIGVAIRAGATGDYYSVTGPGGTGTENETGFNVKLFNSAGTRISGTINYVAYGYGKRTV